MISIDKISATYRKLLACFLLRLVFERNWVNLNSLKTFTYSIQLKNSTRSSTMSNMRGFTLIELMVTIAILAIIVTIATPSILTQLANMESRRVSSQLKNTLSLAKSESYISRQDILVCLSNDGKLCNRNSDKMILLFVDKNNNKSFETNSDTLLAQQFLNLKYSTVKLRVGANRHYTKFWGNSGKPRGHFGHIKYCPTSTYSHSKYQISFNQNGIIRQKLDKNHPTECNK